MEQNDALKQELLNALKESNYKVEITEPNNVELCQKYDGSQFLLIHGDTVKFGVWCGDCSVIILGHKFTCDLDFGEWSAEQDDDEWLLEEEDFVDALESADGVIFGEQGDVDAQRMVYCRANNMSEDIDAYWVEEDDIPKNINDMDWCDPEPGTVTITTKDGEKEVVECDLDCESIYKLYCVLKEKGQLYKTPTISSAFIESEVPELHKEILEELQDNGIDNADSGEVNYALPNTEDFFELILG